MHIYLALKNKPTESDKMQSSKSNRDNITLPIELFKT